MCARGGVLANGRNFYFVFWLPDASLRTSVVDPSTSKLVAVPSGHPLSKGVTAVFTIDVGEGGGIALRACRQQGSGGDPYVSVDKVTSAPAPKSAFANRTFSCTIIFTTGVVGA